MCYHAQNSGSQGERIQVLSLLLLRPLHEKSIHSHSNKHLIFITS